MNGYGEGAEQGGSRDLLHYLRKTMVPFFEWDKAADALAQRIAAGQTHLRASPRDTSFDGLLAPFARDGVATFGPLLAPAAVAEIVAYLRDQPGYAGHHKVSSDGVLRPFAEIAATHRYCAYAPETVLAAPHLLALANRPAILDFVEAALGCVPTLYSVNAWWSFPIDGEPWPPNSQHFHRDDDDFRFFTLFAYLTDVAGLEDGPNQILPGSHTRAGMAGLLEAAQREGRLDPQAAADPMGAFGIQWPQPPDRVPRNFGPAIVSTLGPAGTCFLADTRTLHRGHMPKARPRLIFWARFGLAPNTNSSDTDLVSGPLPAERLAVQLAANDRNKYVNRMLISF